MCSSDHLVRECVSGDSHANSSHLSESESSRVKLVTPFVHLGRPVREASGEYWWEVIRIIFWSLSNFPHESPLSVIDRY
jgi:hypothetical protein